MSKLMIQTLTVDGWRFADGIEFDSVGAAIDAALQRADDRESGERVVDISSPDNAVLFEVTPPMRVAVADAVEGQPGGPDR